MKLTLLGSTGSIGTQAIDVALHLGLTVEALSAHSNGKLLEEQLRRTGARVCAMADEAAAKDLKDRRNGGGRACRASRLGYVTQRHHRFFRHAADAKSH